MVHRTYAGLGSPDAAAREFEALRPYVRALWGLQATVGYFSRDGSALDIALSSLQTAAFHFTRRRDFFGARDPLPDALAEAPLHRHRIDRDVARDPLDDRLDDLAHDRPQDLTDFGG